MTDPEDGMVEGEENQDQAAAAAETDADQGAAAATNQAVADEPPVRNPIPYQDFQKRIQAKNRKIEERDAALAEMQARLDALEGRGGQSLTPSQGLIREAVSPDLEKLNQKLDALTQDRDQDKMRSEIRTMHSEWKSANASLLSKAPAEVRAQVDSDLEVAAQAGAWQIDPNVVLERRFGEWAIKSGTLRSKEAATRAAAAAQANATVGMSAGPTMPTSGREEEKPLHEMTREEIERKYGSIPIGKALGR